jgi:hypothetical protein
MNVETWQKLSEKPAKGCHKFPMERRTVAAVLNNLTGLDDDYGGGLYGNNNRQG